ncbi:MAG: peptidoglycan editing factor PgeF [Pseudomonadota bacterium]|jgi:YfiH family protein
MRASGTETLASDVRPQGWQAADAPWPPGVVAGISERAGGVSAAPWDSFNLGDHVGDARAHVQANRQRLAAAIGLRPVFMRQVHGSAVLQLHRDTPDGLTADACWTEQPGLACTVLVADCLPLLLAAPDGTSVAAVHAGWRGLAGGAAHGTHGMGVLEALCEAWPAAQQPRQRAAIQVWLGPCIGPQRFEVGPEVRQAFVAHDPAAAACFTPLPPATGAAVAAVEAEAEQAQAPKYLADLPALAHQRLVALGFERVAGNDGSAQWCTASQRSRFFSHRRDGAVLGASGRMAACIGRRV